jgi:hypothetical protein
LREHITERLAWLGLGILVVLGALGNSLGMLFSLAAMAAAWHFRRSDALIRRLLWVGAAGLAASLVGEVIHTGYHWVYAPTGNDAGGFYFSATVVPLINAAAFATWVLAARWLEQRFGKAEAQA